MIDRMRYRKVKIITSLIIAGELSLETVDTQTYIMAKFMRHKWTSYTGRHVTDKQRGTAGHWKAMELVW